MVSIEFLITSLVVVLIPGTGVIYTIATGLLNGKSASCIAAFGCTLGIMPALFASVFGLATLMQSNALAFQSIKFAGVIYLLYLALQMWRTAQPLSINTSTHSVSFYGIALKGFLINILNPKLILFFLAFLPQFVSEQTSNAATDMLVLGSIFMAMTFCIFVLYGFLAGAFSKVIISSERASVKVQRGFAVCFALLGAKLAAS